MGLYRKDGNWFIDYRANGRRIREKVGSSKKLAESVLAKRKFQMAEKRFLDVRTAFGRALRVAGIADFHFHDLRHTAISYMMMNGVDLKTIAEFVGHATAQMVDKRYGHLSPDHKRAAVEVFGSAMDKLSGYVPDGAKLAPRGPRVDTFWTPPDISRVGPVSLEPDLTDKIKQNIAFRRRSSGVEQPPCKPIPPVW